MYNMVNQEILIKGDSSTRSIKNEIDALDFGFGMKSQISKKQLWTRAPQIR